VTTQSALPTSIADPINVRILAVSEDCIQGFQRDPLGEISRQSGVPMPVVIERIRAMLEAGTIRRVRQTLMATNLAAGALVAWQVPEDRLEAAFDFMVRDDPFSGHVVIRSTDSATAGSNYRLWTTLKVPQGYPSNGMPSSSQDALVRALSVRCPLGACSPWASVTRDGAAWSRAPSPMPWPR
jgi:DNA-binding Lrp family transcriptional regulator